MPPNDDDEEIGNDEFGFDEEETAVRVRCLSDLLRARAEASGADADVDPNDAEALHRSLLRLSSLVYRWNARLNLISRKECTSPMYVYDRHVLPSAALLPLIPTGEDGAERALRIADVGTGGGFPGLPLAILLPEVEFTLVDSVKKKLTAVSEMAAECDLENVRVHWGRAEEMASEAKDEHAGKYDAVLGRSVTALPRFCFWITDILRRQGRRAAADDGGEGGKLVYIIGGEVEPSVQSRIAYETSIDDLLNRPAGTSDKRALILSAEDVRIIAKESGESRRGRPESGKKKKSKDREKGPGAGKKTAKGEWTKKRNDFSVKKQRGYDDFQRYEF